MRFIRYLLSSDDVANPPRQRGLCEVGKIIGMRKLVEMEDSLRRQSRGKSHEQARKRAAIRRNAIVSRGGIGMMQENKAVGGRQVATTL